MSVITSLTAVPNRIGIVWNVIRAAGPSGISRTELVALIGPPALQKRGSGQETDDEPGSTISDQVIAEMRTLGLLHESDTGMLVLGTAETISDHEAGLLEFFERVLLHQQVADRHGQHMFPRALAWFLTRDPASGFLWSTNYREQIDKDCGSDSRAWDLTNVARFQQFWYWARYLGFAWHLSGIGQDLIFPDPTVAFARHLSNSIVGPRRTTIQEFVRILGDRLPVVEGGAIRNAIESLLPAERRRPEGQLSRSTSLALERLEAQGTLILENLADGISLSLDRATSGLRPISHLTWRPRKDQ